MIPIRIGVEGFMSYKEPAVLDFEGAPLWMLSGPNGAGKSTIFDAITYALFGLHRGGKQNADELINQNSNGLVVEFDFAVGDDVYRAKRTYPRKGRGSMQGFHVRGPNAPQPGRPSPQAVPETDQKIGFENWVSNLIGLDDETFTASVLLQQGRSEVLLEANPAKRHEMLAQIVDLSSYQTLHEKADTRRRELDAKAKILDTQLQGSEPVDDEQIEKLGQQASEAREAAEKLRAERIQLAGWVIQAESWERFKQEQAEIEAALQTAQELFAEAGSIERDATRQAELIGVLPRLSLLLEERRELQASQSRIAALEKDAAHWQEAIETTSADLQNAQAERACLENEERSARERRDAANARQLELAAPLQELNELARVQEEVRRFDEQLGKFPGSLDENLAGLENEAVAQRELGVALPWLEQWVKARAAWDDAKLKAAKAGEDLGVAQSTLQDLVEREAQLQQTRAEAAHKAESCQKEVTQARTLLEQVKNSLGRFEQVDGQPSCNFCGQPLTPDHLDQERARLEQEYAEYSAQLQESGVLEKQATTWLKEIEEQTEVIRQERRSLEQQEYEAKCKQTEARDEGRNIKSQAETALSNLPQEWAERIQPDATVGVIKCFTQTFLTETELDELRQQASDGRDVESQLRELQNQITRRDQLRAQREPAAARQSTLLQQYPPEQATALRAEAEQAKRESAEAEAGFRDLQEPLTAAREAETIATRTAQEARDQSAGALGEAKIEAAHRAGIERGLQNRLADLPAAWREVVEPMEDQELQTQISAWQNEAEALQRAAQRLEELRAAQSHFQARQDRQKTLIEEIAAIPPQAQSPAAELQEQAAAVQQQAESADSRTQVLVSEKQTLEERRLLRAELEEEYNHTSRQAQLHKILADLLGRDKLQRFLLYQAEAGIVANANHVLDRISGGTLRLELRRTQEENEEDDGSTRRARANVQKALDLVAYNIETGGKPLPVYLLSGSQRFRVAVSLALGIGQFASQSARRIESVIIDEGFGSLDQEGRREIIEELHNLKTVLKRIVLVSHQEEFADAFPNRYAIELKNGTSTASLVEAV